MIFSSSGLDIQLISVIHIPQEMPLQRIESKISKALIDNEISHEDFETIINEEEKYRELKVSIRMINIQRSDVEKVNLIEEGKKNRY